MNVKELREYLAQFPDGMEVLIMRMSDYWVLDADEHMAVEKAVKFDGTEWVTRYHFTMDDAKKKMARDYLLIRGN
jgi:hypothetical protein